MITLFLPMVHVYQHCVLQDILVHVTCSCTNTVCIVIYNLYCRISYVLFELFQLTNNQFSMKSSNTLSYYWATNYGGCINNLQFHSGTTNILSVLVHVSCDSLSHQLKASSGNAKIKHTISCPVLLRDSELYIHVAWLHHHDDEDIYTFYWFSAMRLGSTETCQHIDIIYQYYSLLDSGCYLSISKKKVQSHAWK